jgi:hypothetical protein
VKLCRRNKGARLLERFPEEGKAEWQAKAIVDAFPGESLRTVANSLTTQIPNIPGATYNGELWRTSSYHASKPAVRTDAEKDEAIWAMQGPPANPPANEMNATEQNETVGEACT